MTDDITFDFHDPSVYRTADRGLAAALIALGFELLAIERGHELDVAKSNPPGRPPFLWDNRQGSVIRWYDYGSAENKLGRISFELETSHADGSAQTSHLVRCTTHLSVRPAADGTLQRIPTTDPNEHWQLFTLFRTELLGDAPGSGPTSTAAPLNHPS